MSEITFEITERIGVIRKTQDGWTRELNRVCWNGGAVKWDIREWDEDHTRMSRGLTLTDEEMEGLVRLYMERGAK